MKLQNEVKLDIPVSEMEDGEIGIITMWGKYLGVIGTVVQLYNNVLISLQKPSGNSWTPIPLSDDCRVRILQKGEVLIIE